MRIHATSFLKTGTIFTFIMWTIGFCHGAIAQDTTYPQDMKQIIGDARSTSTDAQSVWVLGPLVNVHSGPGKGYPIVNTLEKGEQLQLDRQYTNWIAVKADNGAKGWVNANNLELLVDADGRPLTDRNVNETAGRLSIHIAAGTLDGQKGIDVGIGYGISEYLRFDGVLRHTTEDYLQGRELFGKLSLDLAKFGQYQTFVNIGYGTLSTDGTINGRSDFDTFKSGIGVRRHLFSNISGTFEYGRDLILISGPSNIHAEAFRIGFLTYF